MKRTMGNSLGMQDMKRLKTMTVDQKRFVEMDDEERRKKRSEAEDDLWASVPQDVMAEHILPKLTDVRDLRRLMQVCKWWRNTICSEPNLICRSFPPPSLLGSSNRTLGIVTTFRRCTVRKETAAGQPIGIFHVYLEQDEHGRGQIRTEIREVGNIRYPCGLNGSAPLTAGACNGLLLMTAKHFDGVPFVIQPSTRQFVSLPKTTPTTEFRSRCVYGLIFDVQSNAYKVSRFTLAQGHRPSKWRKACGWDMLTLGEDYAWRRLPDVPYRPTCNQGVAIKGQHLVYKVEDAFRKLVLLTIDPHRETFQEKPHPASWNHIFSRDLELGVAGGCLIVNDRSGIVPAAHDNYFHVWMLKDYNDDDSWVLRYTIPSGWRREVPIAIWGEEVLLRVKRTDCVDCLRLYNTARGGFRRVGKIGRVGLCDAFVGLGRLGACDAVEYEERLVPSTLRCIVKGRLQVEECQKLMIY